MSGLKVCPQCGTEYPASERFCAKDGTALRSASADADLVGSIIADRYHVIQKLGEGGMGQVYLAEHVKMGRKSAVKVMRSAMVKDLGAISRFNREASHASRINHPNVVAIYDFGETTDGLIYLAMEYVEGQSLTSIIAEHAGKGLSPMRVGEIIRQAADALGAAHEMGIVHRDLKPDNILVARTRDGKDLVKVVDFGIAKTAGAANDAQKVTKTGHVIGTPEYMSPEQLSGDAVDARSDIYSLALVAYHALTGVLPFPSDSAQESMIMRLTDQPKPLAAARPDVAWTADIQVVIGKALERDADARYRTAPEFGRDLCWAIERLPSAQTRGERRVPGFPAAVPPTRVTAAPRRGRPIVAAVLGLVIVVGGGLAVMTAMRGAKSPPAASDPHVRATQPIGTQAGAQAPARQSLAEQLRGLIDSAGAPGKAAEVLAKVAMLEPRATSSEELYLAATLRARVFETRGDTARACAELKKVIGSLAKSEADMVNDRTTHLLFCPR